MISLAPKMGKSNLREAILANLQAGLGRSADGLSVKNCHAENGLNRERIPHSEHVDIQFEVQSPILCLPNICSLANCYGVPVNRQTHPSSTDENASLPSSSLSLGDGPPCLASCRAVPGLLDYFWSLGYKDWRKA